MRMTIQTESLKKVCLICSTASKFIPGKSVTLSRSHGKNLKEHLQFIQNKSGSFPIFAQKKKCE